MAKPIQVIERALAVMESVSAGDEGNERSLHDIIQDTGLKAPTAARIAQTLVQCGYLEQKERKKGYLLGWKAYNLTRSREAFRPLIELAKPALYKFHESAGEYIALSVLQNRKRLIADYILSSKVIQGRSPECESPFNSLSGRLLLAWLPEQEQRRIYRENGNVREQWELAGNEDDGIAELAELRRDGIHGEELMKMNWTTLAAPVLFKGRCVAVFGTYLPKGNCDRGVGASLEKGLLKAKESLERKLAGLSKDDTLKFAKIFNS